MKHHLQYEPVTVRTTSSRSTEQDYFYSAEACDEAKSSMCIYIYMSVFACFPVSTINWPRPFGKLVRLLQSCWWKGTIAVSPSTTSVCLAWAMSHSFCVCVSWTWTWTWDRQPDTICAPGVMNSVHSWLWSKPRPPPPIDEQMTPIVWVSSSSLIEFNNTSWYRGVYFGCFPKDKWEQCCSCSAGAYVCSMHACMYLYGCQCLTMFAWSPPCYPVYLCLTI